MTRSSRSHAAPTALAALLLGALVPLAPDARADESTLELAPGPERELVNARCVVCHSVDYIVMNAPIQGRSGWEATVNKMIRVMQAPITAPEAATIVAYLDAHYGAPQVATRP